ncbi:MAG: Glycosyl transferase group 1 [Candidatus Curtissbacteria bacterium GW2011_GWC1_44_33]|uniref:Glycosyl transferase group 1 n=1 Tax=Candidatus Curtissbacteria bacterium GW2011_GWC1_44_33 TaxID=1618413 RepID=A0A0G1J748_9BACT|nr:MAG: Glycosyl transferase group 1 [Candidatus Curtissbacteria bacterium GW2011_GWC1_44_33]
MKILMLTPYLPYPPSSGGQVRSYNLIKHLSQAHEITLFSLIKTDEERRFIPELKKYCKKVFVFKRSKSPWTLRNVLLTGLGPYPFLVIRNLSPRQRSAISQELAKDKYDLIHAETFYVMPHIPKTDIPILLVEQTIEYLVYKHFSIDLTKLKYWETLFWKKADGVVAVSKADKKEMLELAPGLDVDIVPNGVDLEFFKVKKSWQDEAPKILFVANFKWLQNVEAAQLLLDEVYPRIHQKFPSAKVWIVGQHIPDAIIKRKSERILVDNLKEDDQEGIREAYFEASVFVSPLRGPGGTRLKHFAAMASKLPLVTTTVGAEGLEAENGVHLLVSDTPEGLALATTNLLKSPRQAEKLAKSARELVEEKFSWYKMSRFLDKIYAKYYGR